MPDITVTADEDRYRNACIVAAPTGTPVSVLAKRYLLEIGSGEGEFEHLRRLEGELRAAITNFDAAVRLPRDAIHCRRISVLRSVDVPGNVCSTTWDSQAR